MSGYNPERLNKISNFCLWLGLLFLVILFKFEPLIRILGPNYEGMNQSAYTFVTQYSWIRPIAELCFLIMSLWYAYKIIQKLNVWLKGGGSGGKSDNKSNENRSAR